MKLSSLKPEQLLTRISTLLIAFIIGLILSGITAFPLEAELDFVASLLGASANSLPSHYSGLLYWIVTVRNGLRATNAGYPFIGLWNGLAGFCAYCDRGGFLWSAA